MGERFNMKKVRSVSKLKVKNANNSVRPQKVFTGALYRSKNLMINKDLLKDKEGGTDFSNYNLDLMKLR